MKRNNIYCIIQCDCGNFIVYAYHSIRGRKTRTCPFCGRVLKIEKYRVIARSSDLDELRAIAWELNRRRERTRRYNIIR
ncbi:MAG: hypothetical protein DRP01_11365 [Archaeoglobales archaeon]|nr:MAG: hypothetical protein DRP01_11365 [Archaeoglobales archaeon]